jgi:formate hydrogenlyase subunit 3/multisubunit Na+/H+ antiporter MnhD subunit
MWILFKLLITSGMVVFISEVAKKSDRLGGLIAALPLVTVLTLIWLYLEKQPESKIANHVVPTLPMFLAFPFLLKRFGFWPTLGISVVITLVTFYIFAKIVKPYGIELL